jgi:hypothetical protein
MLRSLCQSFKINEKVTKFSKFFKNFKGLDFLSLKNNNFQSEATKW